MDISDSILVMSANKTCTEYSIGRYNSIEILGQWISEWFSLVSRSFVPPPPSPRDQDVWCMVYGVWCMVRSVGRCRWYSSTPPVGIGP